MSELLTAKATFAAGCFWGVESIFRQTHGVVTTRVGYTGGHTQDPTYQQVCTGQTGHAEAVEIIFDPAQISYEKLLAIFWESHNPTTLNRQGPDIGTQYRSAIFYHDDVQRDVAREVIAELTAAGEWSHPVVTEVVPAEVFYPAEQYHQHYFDKNPYQPYCQAVIGPKLEKLRTYFAPRIKPEAL